MEPTPAERWSLIAASILLIIGMMYVALNAANDSAGRAKLARGISTSPAPTVPVNGGFIAGQADATPTPQPVAGGLPGIGEESRGGSSGGGSSGGGSGSPVNPGAAAPPKAGKYAYTTSSGAALNLVVEARPSSTGVRQREYFTDENGQPAGSGDQNVWWKADSKVIEDGKYGQGDRSTNCNWEPDLLQYVLPLNANSSWKIDSSCPTDLGPQGGPGKITNTGNYRVVGTERLQVGGKSVDCWVIEGTSDTVIKNATGQTVFSFQSTSRDWFAPKYGVSARALTTTSGGFGEGTESTNLQSVDPK